MYPLSTTVLGTKRSCTWDWSYGVNIRLTTEDLDYGDEKEGADVADEPVTQRDGTEYPRHKEDDASSSKHDGRNL